MRDVKSALRRLTERYVERYHAEHGSLPRQRYDPAWPSPCQVGAPDWQDMIEWRPVERDEPADFGGLERALETELHPDVKAYYGSFWCDVFEAEAEEGGVTVIQVWSPDDFDRLVENVLGHAMAKRRIKAPLTVFVACTDEDELMLSVDNASGEVVLESPGRRPLRTVAPSLAQFLDRLTPTASRDPVRER